MAELRAQPSASSYQTPARQFSNQRRRNNDVHFAFRTDDFEGVLARLVGAGFSEAAEEDSPMRLLVNRSGMAGFLQLYVMDPDRNIIEVNTAS
jgi:glyoxylase I family protein